MTVTPRSEVGYVYGMETERKLCFWLTLIVFMNGSFLLTLYCIHREHSTSRRFSILACWRSLLKTLIILAPSAGIVDKYLVINPVMYRLAHLKKSRAFTNVNVDIRYESMRVK